MHALKSLLVFSVVGHGSILNTKLLARVGLDMLVPLQTTIHGHIVVVVATNDFTKLVELHLLASNIVKLSHNSSLIASSCNMYAPMRMFFSGK